MPKKTRQEKILARLHRLNKEQLPNQVGEAQENTVPTLSPQISFKLDPYPNSPASNSTKTNLDYSYVYKDLTKTLVFAVTAIIFQILLAVFVIN